MEKRYYIIIGIICAIALIIGLVLLFSSKSRSQTSTKAQKLFEKLNSIMPDSLRTPELKSGNPVRVYVSAGMFDIADTIYAVGFEGMKPGLEYQSINLLDMICNISDAQWQELYTMCDIYDVPRGGIVEEIQKMGWECFCPVRDGITLATVLGAINEATYEDIIAEYKAPEQALARTFANSLFQEKTLTESTKSSLNKSSVTKDEIITYARGLMMQALFPSVGANDLFNMYSNCNVCLMNFNGIQADDGAVAEIGQLGARGVPSVILKSSVTSNFGGATNPMPTMATSAINKLCTDLTRPDWAGRPGALPYLKEKVDRFIKAADANLDDPITNGSYNTLMPLPGLQIFWSELGSRIFLLKHKNKSIATLPNGKVDFDNDYTDFWRNAWGKRTGMVQLAKAMADAIDELKLKPEYKNVFEYWS